MNSGIAVGFIKFAVEVLCFNVLRKDMMYDFYTGSLTFFEDVSLIRKIIILLSDSE